jgi:hypothetical protein
VTTVGKADLGAWLPGPADRPAAVPAPGALGLLPAAGPGRPGGRTPGKEGGYCHDA